MIKKKKSAETSTFGPDFKFFSEGSVCIYLRNTNFAIPKTSLQKKVLIPKQKYPLKDIPEEKNSALKFTSY